MALQTVTPITRVGNNLTSLLVAADAGGTDWWVGSGAELLVVQNGSGAPITVTLTYVATTDGQTITNRTVSVPAGAYMVIGPFPTALYNSVAAGQVTVGWSATGSVKLAVFKFTPSS